MVKGIFEGCMHDDVCFAHYLPLDFDIPEVDSFVIGNGDYCKLSLSRKFVFPENRIFLMRPIYGKNASLNEIDPDLKWCFEMYRSLVCEDGRVYLNENSFERGFDYYLDFLPKLLSDSKRFFLGERISDFERRII